MGGLKKVVKSVTDTVGLTDTEDLEKQQRQYEEQQRAIRNQAELDATTADDNITQTDTGGAAQQSAIDITNAQKKRRAGAISSVLGL